MKKIEVVTRPEKLVGLKEVLASHNCQGMTVTSVMGCGRQKGYLPEMNFTGEDINLLPKIMVFVVVEDEQTEEILADISTAVGTGKNSLRILLMLCVSVPMNVALMPSTRKLGDNAYE